MVRTAEAFHFLAPGEGKPLHVLGETIKIKLRGSDTGGLYSMIETEAPPGGGPPIHLHHREDESFYVLEGEFEVRLGDQTLRAVSGSFLFAPRGVPHTYRNVGNTTRRFVAVISPPGFQDFFEEIHELSQAGPPPVEEVVTCARKYDLEFVR